MHRQNVAKQHVQRPCLTDRILGQADDAEGGSQDVAGSDDSIQGNAALHRHLGEDGDSNERDTQGHRQGGELQQQRQCDTSRGHLCQRNAYKDHALEQDIDANNGAHHGR
jgi:hypothetical protein